MSKMIQVRGVSDELHGTLKARAAREGMSLSDFIKRELERTARASDHARVARDDATHEAHSLEAERRPDRARTAGRAMIVLDASIVVELLSNGPMAETLRRDLAESDESFIVPHLLDVEVTSALRRLVAGQRIDSRRSEELLEALALLPAERYSHISLLGRIWELRHNFTAYDAAYIALAEATGAVLYTFDEKLRRGHRARVVVFAQ